METCCWENEQYETRTKQTVNQAHRFIAKRFRWLKCWERILFRIICLFNTRPRRGQTEAERYGIRRKRVPALLRPNFIFLVFVSDTIVATSISQPLFRKQIGHSVMAVLEEICYFEFRRFVPDTGRDRAIGTNQAVGKRQTKYAPTLFHILSIILCRIRRCYKDN